MASRGNQAAPTSGARDWYGQGYLQAGIGASRQTTAFPDFHARAWYDAGYDDQQAGRPARSDFSSPLPVGGDRVSTSALLPSTAQGWYDRGYAHGQAGALREMAPEIVFQGHYDEGYADGQAGRPRRADLGAPRPGDGALLRVPDSPEVWRILGGQRHLVVSPAEFNRRGYSWAAVQTVSRAVLESYPRGADEGPEIYPGQGGYGPQVQLQDPMSGLVQLLLLSRLFGADEDDRPRRRRR